MANLCMMVMLVWFVRWCGAHIAPIASIPVKRETPPTHKFPPPTQTFPPPTQTFPPPEVKIGVCPPIAQPVPVASSPPLTERVVCNCNCNPVAACPTERSRAVEECSWNLVFKAVKGNGRNVFSDFTDDVPINENVPEARDVKNSALPFKSSLLRDWNKILVKQVKVEVFKERERQARLLFDGLASNRTNWFSQDRLIASPYSRLKTGTFAHFSVEGKPNSNIRFFISEEDGTCMESCWYLMVVNPGVNTCSWASMYPQPFFLYSPDPEVCSRWTPRPACPGLTADIVFVVDTSGSIDDTEFTKLLAFLQNFVASLTTSSELVRIGAISFSTDVSMEFKLNEFFTQTGIISAINGILNTFGGTNTAAALDFLKSTAFLPENGNRAGVPDVVILLTDGQSTDPSATLSAVNNIQSEGYLIFTVGIGSTINQAELNAISSEPDSTFSLTVNDFSTLNSILTTLLDSACTAANPNLSLSGAERTSKDNVADVLAVSLQTCEID